MVNRHIKNLILYKLVVVEGRLLREQHERKIHFFRAPAKKLVGAVPAESVPGTETNFVYAKNHHFLREEK